MKKIVSKKINATNATGNSNKYNLSVLGIDCRREMIFILLWPIFKDSSYFERSLCTFPNTERLSESGKNSNACVLHKAWALAQIITDSLAQSLMFVSNINWKVSKFRHRLRVEPGSGSTPGLNWRWLRTAAWQSSRAEVPVGKVFLITCGKLSWNFPLLSWEILNK